MSARALAGSRMPPPRPAAPLDPPLVLPLRSDKHLVVDSELVSQLERELADLDRRAGAGGRDASLGAELNTALALLP